MELPVLLLTFLALSIQVIAQSTNYNDPTLLHFQSRPDLYPPRLYVNVSDSSATPGYIFMAPYQSVQSTAQIYDATTGNLIWTGFGQTGAGNVQNFHLCQYSGSPHLCYMEGTQYSGYARGRGVIMNTNLEVVRTINTVNGLAGVDLHEFNLIGDSVLVSIYEPQQYDLTSYGVNGGQGWLLNCYFQDIDLTTGALNFQWSAVEHVVLSESFVPPNGSEVAGTGLSAMSAWDFFHINSVDKNADGDYLISSRHTSTLFKISGQDGSIIWRCGGMMSDFSIQQGLNWSYQHDARWISYNASTEIISFFDNASNGYNQSANHSSGYIIKIDHTTTPGTVSLLKSYPAPPSNTISSSQGNVQVLNPSDWSNSQAVVNWGSQPYVTEHSPNGTIIYQAYVYANGRMNYRGFKFNTTLTPTDDPALYTYARNTSTSTVYYMSWNGASEVARWRVYGKNGINNTWTLIDNIPKTNFETSYTAQGYYEYGLVEALFRNGSAYRNSSSAGVRAFVPGQALAQSCNGTGCAVVTPASTSATASGSATACSASGSSGTDETSGASGWHKPDVSIVVPVAFVLTFLI